VRLGQPDYDIVQVLPFVAAIYGRPGDVGFGADC
jgi:hypothetical protein